MVSRTALAGAVALTVAIAAAGCGPVAGRPAEARGCPSSAVVVPDVVGRGVADAYPVVTGAKLVLGDVTDATGQGRHVLDRDNWRIVAQDPAAGSCVDLYAHGYAGRQLKLSVVKYTDPVAAGGTQLIMPDYVGKDLKSARAEIGLMVSYKNGITTTDPYGHYASDTDRVVATVPAAGEPVPGGVTITVVDPQVWDFFATHPKMPSLVGKKWDDSATGIPAIVFATVFTQVTERTPPSGYDWGDRIVTRTDPAAGQPLVVGDPIRVYTEVKSAGRIGSGGGSTGSGSKCHPAYSPCVPIAPSGDWDCAELKAMGIHDIRVNVGGHGDPYRLDNSDPDSIGCEL